MSSGDSDAFMLEMSIGRGFLMGMGVPWECNKNEVIHGNGKK